MTTTAAARGPAPGPRRKRATGPASIRAELLETSAGWVLTLRCDEASAAALRSAGLDGRGGGHLSVSVTPNLVPGEPFDVRRTVVVLDEA